MTAYRIANWERLYETAETRKIKRLAWVATRNKHDGLGYTRMVAEPDACELFCAWNLMLQVASKGEGPERGTLVRSGVGLTPDDLAGMTRFPARIFERAMTFFSSHNIGWLEKLRQISGEHPDTSGEHPENLRKTNVTGAESMKSDKSPAEQNRTEQKEENNTAAVAAMRSSAEVIYDNYPRKVAKPAALRKITAALKTVDATWLLERTKNYAAATAGMEPQFIPHPSTWFHQERYKDDPATWNQSSGKRNKSGQPVREVEYPSADDALRRAGV